MINKIIISPFNFFPLSSDFSVLKYLNISKGDLLVILRELNLAEKHAAVGVAVTVAAQAADLAADRAGATVAAYNKIYDQAKQEFEKTRKIKGFELLNLKSFEKVWVSYYDMEFL